MNSAKLETSQLLKKLGAAADRSGIGSLSEDQKNVLVPYWARGIIDNGGFKYFFEGSYPLGDVAQRFHALGLHAAADACEEAQSLVFGGTEAPRDVAERRRVIKAFDWGRVTTQQRAIFALKWEELESAIQRYVESHPEQF